MLNGGKAAQSGDLESARREYLKAATLGVPGAAARAEQMRTQLIARYSAAARAALARQDLDGSIENWQRVLDLDPDNTIARLEIERARGLKEKLRGVK